MKVPVSNASLNVEVSGNGEPVIFVHGIGADLTLWKEVVPHFLKKHKVICYDLRGSGLSDFTTNPPLSIELWAKDLKELMERLDVKSASLVGWSLGGIISIQFCLEWPEMTNSLVLVGSTTKLQPSARELFEKRAQLAESKGMKALVDETFYLTREAFAPSVRTNHPEKVDIFRKLLEGNDKNAYAAESRALIKTDLTPKLKEIKKPALLLVGQYDSRTPLADSELMCTMMPNSFMKIMPDCGHFYPLEQPEMFSREVLRFLAVANYMLD